MNENPLFDTIRKDISENDVVLYMKGTSAFPQCGFSAVVVNILTILDVPFKAVNILEDDQMRQAIKDFTNWPTIPQLYVKGEFVGGCDITKEMFESGELQEMFRSKNIRFRDAA